MPYTLHILSIYVISILHGVFELFQSEEDEDELPVGGASFGWFNDMFVYDTGMFLLSYNQKYISDNTNVSEYGVQDCISNIFSLLSIISGHFWWK